MVVVAMKNNGTPIIQGYFQLNRKGIARAKHLDLSQHALDCIYQLHEYGMFVTQAPIVADQASLVAMVT